MSTNEHTTLGEIIREALKKSGFSQATIADRMGLTRQAINKIASRKTFDLEFLQKLKNASGLDFTEYVFEPRSKKYVDINELTKAAEPGAAYPASNSVTLNFSVSCDRDRVGEFSKFLAEIDRVAGNYGFKII